MNLNEKNFNPHDLVKVEGPKTPVILKSGGPIMEASLILEDLVLCTWENGQAFFPKPCLYMLKIWQE